VLILQNEQVDFAAGWGTIAWDGSISPLAAMLEACHVCGASAEQGGHRNTQVVVKS